MSEPIRISIAAESADSVPAYASEHAAGMDLKANSDLELAPGERVAVRTGIRVAIPSGFEGQVRPRSGLALKYGISVPNAPGTIDSDYRGEVKVILANHGSETFSIKKGDRIAQLVVCPVARVAWDVCAELPESERGEGGFGSTGVAG